MIHHNSQLTDVFTYGSLMYKQVIGKLVKGAYKSQRGSLKNYERRHVKNAVYPGVIKSEGKQVAGVIYYGVSKQDMDTLDYFESQQYTKDQVQIVTQSGKTIKAIVYRYIQQANLEPGEWRIEQFQKLHKYSFADGHLEVKENGHEIPIIQQTHQKVVFSSAQSN